LAGALPWVGQAFTKARSLYFSLIQNQIVCIDDLDRRSKNLELKDALGLISFMCEQRGCKVTLLLNAEKLGDKKDEFEGLLEKVVEAKVVLAPTAADRYRTARPRSRFRCTSGALQDARHSKHPRRQTNRALARRVDELLIECRQTIRDQATHSLTLFGWSKYDRENAPKMEFLRVRVEEDSRRPILPRSPALRVFGSVSLMNLWQAPMLPALGNPTKQLQRNKLHEEVEKALQVPPVQERLLKFGVEPMPMTFGAGTM
jgi:hypothetical protein